MRLIDRFKILAQEETPAERRQRMLPGAVYGLVIAGSYALVGSLVNRLSFPDVPVGVNWQPLLVSSLFFALWLGTGGALVNWFTQIEDGLVISWMVMFAIALGASWLTFEGPPPTQLGRIFLLVLPAFGLSLLMTLTLRWLGSQHANTLERKDASLQRRISSLVATAILIGSVTGVALTRWSSAVQRGVRYIHQTIQTLAADPSGSETLFLMRDLPGIRVHLNSPYTLRGKFSGQSVVGVEVNIDFQDGYRVTCGLLVFPNQDPFPATCVEGEEISLPLAE